MVQYILIFFIEKSQILLSPLPGKWEVNTGRICFAVSRPFYRHECVRYDRACASGLYAEERLAGDIRYEAVGNIYSGYFLLAIIYITIRTQPG